MSEVRGTFSAAESAHPDWPSGIMLAGVVQFEAVDEATYTIEQIVDDAAASLPIHVVHGLPPGIPATE